MAVIKKSVAMLLVVTMLFAAVVTTTISASAVTPLGHLVQWEAQWKNYYYGGRNLYNTGCGIFALVNCVGYLTGQRMSITSTASWAHSIGAFNTPSAGGTYRTALYPRVQAKYGATYGFTVDCGSGNTGYWSTAASSTLKSHLANGGVAVGHVPGHFIALVGYDYSTNKFHVYDSAPSTSRGTSTNRGDCWVTQSRLSTGKLDLDWFCLLSATGTPAAQQKVWAVGNYELLGSKYLRESASTSSNIITTVPKGEIIQVVEIVNNSFGRIQYGDAYGYMTLDEDTKWISGITEGGVTITSPDERVPNQDYVATWLDAPGSSGYYWQVVELDGDPGCEYEGKYTLITESFTYLYKQTSLTIPAASLTNGKILKISVQTMYPDNKSYWSEKYVTSDGLPYSDVAKNSWYHEYVKYAYDKGYMTGVSATEFAPDTAATKGMIVQVAYRLAGTPAHNGTALPFTDVADGAWYKDALTWCYENGVVEAADTFGQGDALSREDCASYFYRLAQLAGEDTSVSNFYTLLYWNDSDKISGDMYEEMAWAIEKSLMNGDTDNNLKPHLAITRAEFAAVLMNYDNVVGAEHVGDIEGDTAD